MKHFDFFLVDTVSLLLSFFLAYLIRSSRSDFINSFSYMNIALWMVIPNLIYFILFNPYHEVIRRDNIEEVKLAFINTFINSLFIISILFVLQAAGLVSRLILLYTYAIYIVVSVITRMIWKHLIRSGIILFNDNTVYNLMLFGDKEHIAQIIYNIRNSDNNIHTIKGVYLTDDNETEEILGFPVIRKLSRIDDFVNKNNINDIFIYTSLNKNEKKVIKKLINSGFEVQLFIDSIFGVNSESKRIGNIGMYNTLQLNSYSFSPSQKAYLLLKRFLDIIAAIIGCILLVPFYIIIKFSYMLTGDFHPIIFTQTRVGLDGKTFDLFKFRSMVWNADELLDEILEDDGLRREWEENQKIDNDPRITKVGRFIRKTSIDEMPQFINVLKGDMSVIGPRPLVPGELYSKNGIKLYERVRPGITGWWACNGRSEMSYEERLEHEYYYIRNISLYLDLLCVFRTVYAVLFIKGAK